MTTGLPPRERVGGEGFSLSSPDLVDLLDSILPLSDMVSEEISEQGCDIPGPHETSEGGSVCPGCGGDPVRYGGGPRNWGNPEYELICPDCEGSGEADPV